MTATLLLSFIGFLSQLVAAPPLEDILNWVELADRSIPVVKTEGYVHYYRWDTTNLTWECTIPNTAFTCVFENRQNGRFVLNEDPTISRWRNGAAPYLAHWTTTFRDADGYVTHWERAYQHFDGTKFISPFNRHDEANREKSGFWASSASRIEKWYAGLGLTAQRALQDTPVRFPKVAKDIIISDTTNGMVHVHCWSPEVCVAWDVILDPKKSFALVRYTYTSGRSVTTIDDERSMTYNVLEHRQIADGVWYPVHYTFTIQHSKEYVSRMRILHPPDSRWSGEDPYKDSKQEAVLTDVVLLNTGDADASLTVTLPVNVRMENDDKR